MHIVIILLLSESRKSKIEAFLVASSICKYICTITLCFTNSVIV